MRSFAALGMTKLRAVEPRSTRQPRRRSPRGPRVHFRPARTTPGAHSGESLESRSKVADRSVRPTGPALVRSLFASCCISKSVLASSHPAKDEKGGAACVRIPCWAAREVGRAMASFASLRMTKVRAVELRSQPRRRSPRGPVCSEGPFWGGHSGLSLQSRSRAADRSVRLTVSVP